MFYAILLASALQVTHPCDVAPVTTIQTATPVAIGFCHAGRDADGNAIPIASLTSFRITMDGNTVFSGPLTPIGAPSGTGMYYFETPKNVSVSKGVHVLVEYATGDGGESAGSDPFSFTNKNSPPGRGRVQSVIK